MSDDLRLGIDLDNTIACSGDLFYEVAVEQGLIPRCLDRRSKTAVRGYLREDGRDDDWTRLQGRVYGMCMDRVTLYPCLDSFLRTASERRIDVLIISHRTRYPYLGPRYDLHESALRFLESAGVVGDAAPVRSDRVYLELSVPDKLSRIRETACTHFIDDLPEVLLAEGFPCGTRRILFDPEAAHEPDERLEVATSWSALERRFFH